jgi:cobalt-zinc-cadmium efflux system protein
MNAHNHSHSHGSEHQLGWALGLTFLILAVEVIGSVLSQSLALIADAGHVVTDVGALALAYFAARQAHRPADSMRTFGYQRAGILAALANAAALLAIALVIGIEAYGRLMHPYPVNPLPMIVAAAIGLAINLFIASRLHGHGHGDLNVRGVWLHVVGDAGAAIGVIVGAAVIALTGWSLVDPLLSVAIAVLIAAGAWGLLRNAVAVLMEGVPAHIDLAEVVRQMQRVPGVRGVHDLHVWTVRPGLIMLSCHVRVDDQSLEDGLSVVHQLDQAMSERFGIGHCTIQLETIGCGSTELYCALPCGCCGEQHGAQQTAYTSATS